MPTGLPYLASFFIVTSLFLVLNSCGGSVAPVSPSPIPTPTPTPTSWTITGRVVGNPNGSMVPGAKLQLGTSEPTITDINGSFTLQGNGSGTSSQLALVANGFVDRTTWLNATNRDNVTVDMISQTAPFSLDFYRQMARNAAESPSLRPINHHTSSPKYYIKTTDENGNDIPQSEINNIISVINNTVPQASGGRFQPIIETGRESRSTSGFTPVNISTNLDVCGRAGLSQVNLKYSSGCSCPSSINKISSMIIAHEIVHSMGFYHVAPNGHIMSKNGFNYCNGFSTITPEERIVASVAYSRPNGNMDPDVDPSDFRLATVSDKNIVTQCEGIRLH